MIRTVLMFGAVLLAVAGCAGSGSGDEPATGSTGSTVPGTLAPSTGTSSEPPPVTESPSRPMSTTVLPTITRPTAPPSTPSDRLTGRRVAGEVTAGGDGPCYTVRSDDGQVYTVSGSGGPLTTGARVVIRVVQPPKPLYCGDLEAWQLLEVVTGG